MNRNPVNSLPLQFCSGSYPKASSMPTCRRRCLPRMTLFLSVS